MPAKVRRLKAIQRIPHDQSTSFESNCPLDRAAGPYVQARHFSPAGEQDIDQAGSVIEHAAVGGGTANGYRLRRHDGAGDDKPAALDGLVDLACHWPAAPPVAFREVVGAHDSRVVNAGWPGLR